MEQQIYTQPQVEVESEVTDSLEHHNGITVAEFYAFVAQNSDVLVESARAPGVKIPFGAMMNMCPEPVTEENVQRFYEEGMSMLQRVEVNDPDEETQREDAEEVSDSEEAKKKLN